MMRTLPILTLATLTVVPPATPVTTAQGAGEAAIFAFHTDRLWLNLHHYLYVLGRHENGSSDRTRRAVAGAPDEAARALATLSPDEQRIWQDAVAFYGAGPSRQDLVFDQQLIETTQALQRVDSDAEPSGGGLDPAIAATLRQAAPIYRKAWWTAHREANERWAGALKPLVDKHGLAVQAFVTRAYGLPWPADALPIQVAAYTNWAGAYSTDGQLLLMSSLDSGHAGLHALESAFHEAMHQWDEAVEAALAAQADAGGRDVPGLLSHALIFYTAGEAVRAAVPDHVPYAEANGLWRQKGLGALKPALDAVWKPYLDGYGTREMALAELVRRTRTPVSTSEAR